MSILKKSDGSSLTNVIWSDEGWILREVTTTYNRPIAAFHRHNKWGSGWNVQSPVECMLNTKSNPGWECRYCKKTAPNGMQALYVMMNWKFYEV